MAKTKKINVVDLVQEYLYYKDAFNDEKMAVYKEQLKNVGVKNNDLDLISTFNGFINQIGSIKVSSLVGKGEVSLDVFLNDCKKTLLTREGIKIKPDMSVETKNNIVRMFSVVEGGKDKVVSAFENADTSEIIKNFNLNAGKLGGKQRHALARTLSMASALSGKNTHINSLEKQIEKLKAEKAKLESEGKNPDADAIKKIDKKIDQLNKDINNWISKNAENDSKVSYLVKTVENSDKKIDGIKVSVEKIGTDVDKLLKEMSGKKKGGVFRKIARGVLVVMLSVLAGYLLRSCIESAQTTGPKAQQVEDHNEILANFMVYLADGEFSQQEYDKIYKLLEEKGEHYQKQYGSILEWSKEGSALQSIKNDIITLANAFDIAGERGLSPEELENKIVNDKEFRAEVIADISQYAKASDYKEIKDIVEAVGVKLDIDAQGKDESNLDFKNRVLNSIGSLQIKNAQLKDDFTDLQNANATLLGNIMSLNGKIKELENDVDRITSEKNTAEANLEKKVKDLNKAKAYYKTEVSKWKDMAAKNEQDLNEAKNKVDELQGLLENSVSIDDFNKVGVLLEAEKAKVQALESEKAELELAGELLKAQNDKLEGLNRALQEEIDSLESTNSEQLVKIGDLENQISELKEDLEEAINNGDQTLIEDLKGQIADKQKEIDELKASKENEISALKKDISDLKEQLKNARSEADIEKIAELEGIIADKEDRIKELTNENSVLIGSVENLQAKVNELNSAITEKEQEIDDLEKDNLILQEEVDSLKAQANADEKLIKEKEELINKQNEDILQLENECTVLENELQKTEEALGKANNTISGLEGQVAELEGKVNILEGKISELNNKIAETEAIANDFEAQVDRLTHQSQIDNAKYQDLVNNYNTLENKHTELINSYNEKVNEYNDILAKFDGGLTAEEAEALNKQIDTLYDEIQFANQKIDEINKSLDSVSNLGLALGINGTPQDVIDFICDMLGLSSTGGSSSGSEDNIKQPGL